MTRMLAIRCARRGCILAAVAAATLALGAPGARAATVSPEHATTTPATDENLATESSPDVACGETSCLTLWNSTSRGGTDLRAARVAADGARLDTPPIVVASDAGPGTVVFSAGEYVIAWPAGTDDGVVVRARRISESGDVGAVIDVAGPFPLGASDVAAASLAGTTLVVWAQAGEGAVNHDVRGARIDRDGSVLDPAGITIASAAGFQYAPAAAASNTGYMVTWSDTRSGSYQIFAARMNADGEVLDPGGGVVAPAGGDHANPSIASDGSDFMIAWTDRRGIDPDVRVARVTAAASVLDPDGVPVSTDVGTEVAGAITHNGASYLLSWDHEMNSGAFGSVLVASIDEDAVATKTSVVADTGAGRNLPRIAARGAGSAIVWRDNSVGTAVKLLRLAGDRTPVDAEPVTVSSGVDHQERPTISYDGTNYLVAWLDRRGTRSTADLRATRLERDGTALDPDGILVASGLDVGVAGAGPKLVSAWDGTSHLLVWSSGGDIRAARVSATGTVLDATPIAVTNTAIEEREPALTAGGANGFFVAWTEVTSDGMTNVVGTRISSAGAIVDGALPIANTTVHNERTPAVAYLANEYHVVYLHATATLLAKRVLMNGTVTTSQVVTQSGGRPLLAVDETGVLVAWRTTELAVVGLRLGSTGSPRVLAPAGSGDPVITFSGGQWVVASEGASGVEVRHYGGDFAPVAFEAFDGEDPAIVAGPLATVGVAYSRWAEQSPYLGATRAFARTVQNFSVRVSASVPSATEGQPLQFTITVTPGRPDATVVVDWELHSTYATPGQDFIDAAGAQSFAPGETSQTVTVNTLQDTADEDNEVIVLELTGASNADLGLPEYGTRTAAATIVDDDPSPTISIADATVAEDVGTASVQLELSAPSQRVISVGITPWPGTAGAQDHGFPSPSTTVSIPPGQTQYSVQFPIVDDALDEDDEYFDLRLGAPQNATIADEWGRVTITDNDPPPGLVVGAAQLEEGDSFTTAVQVPVTLTAPSSRTITAKLSTADGTATAPGDYGALSNVALTFNPGETRKLVSVSAVGDTVDEADETFAVTLSEPVNATLSVPTATVTILDDDGPTVSVADAGTDEAAGSALEFEIALSSGSVQDVSGTCATSDGTATAGADYTARSASFTIPAGASATSFAVPVLGDALDEADETLTLTCTVGRSGELGDGDAVGTIADDDPTPTLAVEPVEVLEGDDSGRVVDVPVRLSAASGRVVTVRFDTGDGSATAPSDYTAATAVALTFQPGETEKLVAVTIAGDMVDEADETFATTLSAAANATLAGSPAGVTILDDDGPSVSVADARTQEGDSGTTPLAFEIALATSSAQDVRGTCSTADASATAGSDYASRSAPFVVAAGDTAASFVVDVFGDDADEPDETLTLACTVDRSGELADGTATGTIVNDDAPAPTVSALDATAVEGQSAMVRVELSAASADTVTLRARTVDGTATAPADFTAVDRVLTFAPGETAQTLEIPTVADTAAEPQESFGVELSEAVGATAARNAVVTLADGGATGGGGGSDGDGATGGSDGDGATGGSDGDGGTATGGSDGDGATGGSDGDGGTATGGSGGAGTTAPGAVVAAGTQTLDRRGRVRVALRCPADAGADACAGTLRVSTAKKVRVGGRRRRIVLGKSTFTIPRGEAAKVVIRLSRANARLVRRLGRVKVIVAAGATRRTVVLRGR